jgi:hypothetical protein
MSFDKSRDGKIVLLAVRDGEGGISFYVPPDLHSVVDEADLEYIREFIADLPDRARLDADALFKQLSSLTVGVLMSRGEQQWKENDDSLSAIRAGLVPL